VPAMQDRADPVVAAVALDAWRQGFDGGGGGCPRCRTAASPWRQRRSPLLQDDGESTAAVALDVGRQWVDGGASGRPPCRMPGYRWRRRSPSMQDEGMTMLTAAIVRYGAVCWANCWARPYTTSLFFFNTYLLLGCWT
jgi:hypothetical protein